MSAGIEFTPRTPGAEADDQLLGPVQATTVAYSAEGYARRRGERGDAEPARRLDLPRRPKPLVPRDALLTRSKSAAVTDGRICSGKNFAMLPQQATRPCPIGRRELDICQGDSC